MLIFVFYLSILGVCVCLCGYQRLFVNNGRCRRVENSLTFGKICLFMCHYWLLLLNPKNLLRRENSLESEGTWRIAFSSRLMPNQSNPFTTENLFVIQVLLTHLNYTMQAERDFCDFKYEGKFVSLKNFHKNAEKKKKARKPFFCIGIG